MNSSEKKTNASFRLSILHDSDTDLGRGCNSTTRLNLESIVAPLTPLMEKGEIRVLCDYTLGCIGSTHWRRPRRSFSRRRQL
jgi:hypothetical protein